MQVVAMGHIILLNEHIHYPAEHMRSNGVMCHEVYVPVGHGIRIRSGVFAEATSESRGRSSFTSSPFRPADYQFVGGDNQMLMLIQNLRICWDLTSDLRETFNINQTYFKRTLDNFIMPEATTRMLGYKIAQSKSVAFVQQYGDVDSDYRKNIVDASRLLNKITKLKLKQLTERLSNKHGPEHAPYDDVGSVKLWEVSR